MRRQTRSGEPNPAHPWNRGRDAFKKFRRELKGQTAIADVVLMAAFESMTRIAKEQRTRRQHGRSQRRAVLERAVRHRRDAYGIVTFFKWAVARAEGANYIVDAPASARSQEM